MINKNSKCCYVVSSCELSLVIIRTYAAQPCITWGNGDADAISRLSSQLGTLLLGHWNVIFNGFSGIQLFYKTLKDLRILSWMTDCLWECTFLPGCFIFLFLYFCLLLRVLSYFIICSCSSPVCFTAAVSIFSTISQSLPLVCFSHPISWFLFHTLFPCPCVSYLL